MNISHLIHPESPREVYSNGNARITQARPIDAEFRANELPSVVYHGPENIPDTGSSIAPKVYIASTETNEEVGARLSKMMLLLTEKLGAASAGLQYSYDDAMSSLPQTLQEKDWGFSIMAGELTVSAGSDDLSERETAMIKDALFRAGVRYHAEAISSVVIKAIELDRGPAGVSNGIGRYDVSHENFGEVVDLRAYLQSHGPGGRYGQHRVSPADVAGKFFTGGQAMMDQISVKAEESYARPSEFGRVY